MRNLELSTTERRAPRRKLSPEQEGEYQRLLAIQQQRELTRTPHLARKTARKPKKVPAKKAAPRKRTAKPPLTRRQNYAKYMQSPAWAKKRQQYFSNPNLPQGCQGCGSSGPGLHLHHRTYERLGDEWLTDLVPVCKECHDRIHYHFDMNKYDLAAHTDKVLAAIMKSVTSGTPYVRPGKPVPAKKQKQPAKKQSRGLAVLSPEAMRRMNGLS